MFLESDDLAAADKKRLPPSFERLVLGCIEAYFTDQEGYYLKAFTEGSVKIAPLSFFVQNGALTTLKVLNRKMEVGSRCPTFR